MGRIITFYSYKGGVGRTMALADVATLLAKWGYRVLCVDWDLEAPGLHTYFAPWMRGAREMDGVLELVESFQSAKRDAWRACMRTLRIPSLPAPLSLLAAGRRQAPKAPAKATRTGKRSTRTNRSPDLREDYLARVQAVNWDRAYQKGLGRFLEQLRSDWSRDYDFVLLDSRTGASDIAGICTIQLPDTLVVLFTPNEQSIEGVRRVALNAQGQQALLPLDRARLLVVPVPSRIDQTEYELNKEWQRRMTDRLNPFFEWVGQKEKAAEMMRHLAVPYVPFWSFGERLPTMVEERPDKLSVRFAHETLAALLARHLANAQQLLLNRDSCVAQAALGPEAMAHDAFISYAPPDLRFARKLSDALSEHGLRVFMGAQQATAESEELKRALHASKALVLVAASTRASSQAAAVERALQAGKLLIPVLRTRRYVEDLPSIMQALRWHSEDDHESAESLAEAVYQTVRASPGTPEARVEQTRAKGRRRGVGSPPRATAKRRR